MRRISLALALLGAIAAAGCGGAGGKSPAPSSGNKGVEQASFKLVVRGENAYWDASASTTIILPKGGVVSGGGIDCGVDGTGALHKACELTLAYNTAVTLAAAGNALVAPAVGNNVHGWAGACGGTGACSFLMTDTKFVAIRFAADTAGLGAHPPFTAGAVHGAEFNKWQQGLPGSYTCNASNCHGAQLQGVGLAPSCTSCHNPPAPASTGLVLAVTSANLDPSTTGTATIRFTVKDSQGKLLDITKEKAPSSTTGSIIPVVLDGTIRIAIARIDTAADGQTLPYAVLTPASGSPSTITIPKVGAAAGTSGALVQNAVGDYTWTSPALPKVKTTTLTKTHTLWFQAGRQVNTANAFDPKGVTFVNYEYNFIPGGGTAAKREVVTSAACGKCHNGFKAEPTAAGTGWATFHSGGRIAGTFCDVCHNPGRTSNPAADAMVFVHRIHGAEQIGLPTNLWFHGIGVTYPMAISNCAECHDGAAQGDQYKTRPTRNACGSCHYAITFDPAQVPTLALHTGGGQANDNLCAGCHSATAIAGYHVPVLAKDPNNSLDVAAGNIRTNAGAIPAVGALPAGAARIAWVIQSVGLDASNHPTISFKFTKDGADAVFNTPPASKPTDKAGVVQLMNGFVGAPSVYFVWSEAQDGITAPADFNKSASANILQVFNKYAAANTFTGPDANGFYTIALTGTTIDPAVAKILTGGVGYSYDYPTQAEYAAGTLKNQPLTQTDVPAYPFDSALGSGGLLVTTPNVKLAATGFTARRAIVDNAKCNACHGFLGVEPNFHVGQRNDGESCAWCHNPNRTSSQWSTNASTFVHAIHGAGKRTVGYNWHAGACPTGTTFTAWTAAEAAAESREEREQRLVQGQRDQRRGHAGALVSGRRVPGLRLHAVPRGRRVRLQRQRGRGPEPHVAHGREWHAGCVNLDVSVRHARHGLRLGHWDRDARELPNRFGVLLLPRQRVGQGPHRGERRQDLLHAHRDAAEQRQHRGLPRLPRRRRAGVHRQRAQVAASKAHRELPSSR